MHAPHVLNLCLEIDEADPNVVRSLVELCTYASAFGARGVVVHLGKDVALANQRSTILRVLESGAPTPECPLLLKTPAWQGTETLTMKSPDDFIEFVAAIDDPRLGVCVDTCLVFAASHSPVAYVRSCMDRLPGRCVDHRAPLGYGCIATDQLVQVAALATDAGVPLIIV